MSSGDRRTAGFSEEEDRLDALRTRFEATDWSNPEDAGTAARDAQTAYAWLLKRFQRALKFSDRIDLQLKSALEQEAAQKRELKAAYDSLNKAQEELVRAEKLAALGGMVAGIAHEVNTPLGIIRTAASTLASETRALEARAREGQARKSEVFGYFTVAGEATQLIESNISRAADLIQSFKEVAVDRSSDMRRRFALGAYLGEVIQTLRPELKKTKLTVSIDCPQTLDYDGFPGAISQIATNMVINSIRHGFGPDAPGTLTFTASENADGDIELVYSDNGMGVPEALHATMFDPFVTTKRGQGGSGLGLNIVHNLVVGKMGGRLNYRDAAGGGATFVMSFPARAPD